MSRTIACCKAICACSQQRFRQWKPELFGFIRPLVHCMKPVEQARLAPCHEEGQTPSESAREKC